MKQNCLKIFVLLFFLFLIGCAGSQPISTREKTTLGGTALGAGVGAIIGSQSGDAVEGAVIGGAIGALSGALAGNQLQRQEESIKKRERIIRNQEQILRENRRLIEELKAQGADVYRTNRGVVVNLPDILFEFDSARLTRDARLTIAQIAKTLNRYSNRSIAVEGHTDSVGTIEYNQRLSLRRAQAVADELALNGVSRNRMTVRGFGETEPIATNRTPEGRARNRRVEVVIENY